MSDSDKRFWAKVRKSEGCWEYTGALNTSGYGWVSRKNKQIGAHRHSWFLANGEIPAGLHVLHKCDNPACVRIDHLYLGGQKENMQDRAKRRRCPTQKLDSAQVLSIRRLRSKGVSCREIAKRFGISNSHVSAIARGKHYGFE